MNVDYDEIEKYVKGELTGDLKDDFEKRMSNDPLLAKEVAFFKESILVLEKSYKGIDQKNKLRETLEDVSEKYFKNDHNTKVVPFKKYVLAATAVAALFIIGFFIFSPNDSLYEQYAAVDSINVQVKGETNKMLLEGVNSFNKKEYVLAKSSFENYLKKQPEDLEIELALGMCYMQLDEMNKARTIFKSSVMLKSVFKDKAQWYLALSYLKENNHEGAKQILNNISESSFYSKKANELLRKIN